MVLSSANASLGAVSTVICRRVFSWSTSTEVCCLRGPSSCDDIAQAGHTLTVADYFESRYRRLRFPHLCCLQVGDPSKVCLNRKW